MAITSFIKPIETRKGIFYTFQSGRNDLTKSFGRKFKFSKFVLLNIPHMGVADDLPNDNTMQFLGAGETVLSEGIDSVNYNVNLSESFQNYCLNLEANLINQDDFDPNNGNTVSERVFWKWLKEMGVVRFRETAGDATDTEKDYSVLSNEKRFVEKDEYDSNTKVYDRVVKYVGDVSMVNNVSGKNSYIEIYVHVPTNVGNIPYALFKSYSDANYHNKMIIQNKVDNVLDTKYLAGRKHTDVHPFGLNTVAFYDIGESSAVNSYISTDLDNTPTTPGRWFTDVVDNSYYTDELFDDATERRILRELVSNNNVKVELVRNNLDGIELDFSLDHYKLANSEEDIKSFADFSSYYNSVDFKFNAVLLYYDIIDPDTGDVLYTNLYGIQFLNKVETDSLDWHIPVIDKYIPDPINNLNGNSFAYKFNFKYDSYDGDIPVESSVNDYNTLSMDLYMDVLKVYQDISDKYFDGIAYVEQAMSEVDALKQLIIDDANKNELLVRISNLEKSYIANKAIFDNTNTVMEMINDLYSKIDNIVKEVTINVTEHNLLNLGVDPEVDIVEKNKIPLLKGHNYIRVVHKMNDGIPYYELTSDLNIFIDDSIGWERGQIFEMVFDGELKIDNYSINIFSDSKNRMGEGEYNKLIGVIDNTVLTNDKGIVKLICSDNSKYKFYMDKIN